ncbi:hydroxyphenylacetyl-CoA thioesterase PaaI [Marinomonas algarum]|uniref:Hydroxyphenylacetyl-CoA thioesterase PaaI n=1 Tax=Marinomonas algarum TaxID=2883105 RepID=A0A9X1IJL6_9GAMM|nr:hydroxyphenylacetyl-CoA thioesterase PaaI [Marinomonas algarum]MCB5160400.1 hydroxyphenylacetyl-CoA thioesterase PaaI [Marinomonas algarum]
MTDSTLRETPQSLAKACANELFQRDVATQHLGMSLLETDVGVSLITMTVKDFMLQGHKTCHGGYMFTLADSAFAFACNTYNKPTVALGCSIDYIAPAFEGDVLSARCIEKSRGGRTGNYDVEIHNQDAKLIAIFHGKSYQVKGQILPSSDVQISNEKQ